MKRQFLENLIRKFMAVCLVGLATAGLANRIQAQQLLPQTAAARPFGPVQQTPTPKTATAALPPVLSASEPGLQTARRQPAGPVATTSLPAILSAASVPSEAASQIQQSGGMLPFRIVPAPLPSNVEQQGVSVPPIIRAPISEAMSEVVEEGETPSLPPIVQAGLPPVVPGPVPPPPPVIVTNATNATNEVPSQTTGSFPEEEVPVEQPEPTAAVHGKNFPKEGSALIANWIKNQATDSPESINSASLVASSAPAANTASPDISGIGYVEPQSGSPSDIAQPWLVSQSAPQDAIDFVPPDGFSEAPSTVYPPQPYPVAQGDQFQGNYFQPQAAPHYPGSFSPAGTDSTFMEDTFSCCGFIVESSGYFVADALLWNRSDGTFRASNIGFIDEFDWAPGGRVTLGRRRDCTRGWEASYMQFDPWLSVNSQFSGSGSLFGAVFPSAGGLPASAFTAFRDGTYMQQFHKTDLMGAEINKTYWGADVAKAFLGLRYIHFDDEFRLASANLFGEQGLHRVDATNNMFGLHLGGEMLYDIGYRLSFSLSGKLGGYANFNRGGVGHLNAGTTHINASRSETDFSSSGEIGAFARLKIGPRSRLRVGYEAMALWNVLDVESNFRTVVLPSAGQVFNDGDAFFHGVTAGFEIFR